MTTLPCHAEELKLSGGGVDEACPETFYLSDSGSLIRRVSLRRAAGAFHDSEVATAGSVSCDDLREAADLAYLRRSTWPTERTEAEEVRVADLFSGCGAMSAGLAEACRALGMRMVPSLVCDTNETALEVYAENFGIAKPEPVDLSQLSSLVHATRTPAEIRLTRAHSSFDVVLAGPPCQGHSNLNNHTRRVDPKNGLYLRVARFAQLFNPKILIVENVPTVLRDKQGVVIRTMQHLEELGYRVSHGTVDLSLIGVAQSRKRHVMIALRNDVGERLPSIAEIVSSFKVPVRPVGWAISDLENLAQRESLLDTIAQVAEVTQQRIDYLFRHDLYDLPDAERPDCHRTKSHTYQSVYGRMKPKLPAPTITSGFNTMGQGRFVHPYSPRTITPHEAARIQFIPDFFSFRSVQHRNRLTEMIGNAVPPKLSYVLGLSLLR